jgi:Flp pilus assembly pilin Flp
MIYAKIKTFFTEETGVTTVEYAVLIGLLLVISLKSMTIIGQASNGAFSKVAVGIN